MRRNGREVIVVEGESSSPIWWLLVGGALGAGLALLFAPQPGSQTRRAVAGRLKKLRESAEEVFDELAGDADDEELELEDAAADEPVVASGDADAEEDEEDDEEEDEAEAAPAPPPKRPVRNARSELEQRLASARARRQRALGDEDEEPVA